MKDIFLYLNEIEHANAWENGGSIPLFNCEKYIAIERKGIKTPDEAFIRTKHQIDEKTVQFLESRIEKEITIAAGKLILPNTIVINNYAQTYESGLILCFSHIGTSEQMKRFEKKAYVRILADLNLLFLSISIQLKIKGYMQDCTYTQTTKRDQFTKFVDDNWQSEFRMFWPSLEKEVWVKLEPKTAILVQKI